MFMVATLMGYGMKFLKEQYSISSGLAGVCGGLITIGGLIGVILPMIPIKLLKWNGTKLLTGAVVSSFIVFLIYVPSQLYLLGMTC